MRMPDRKRISESLNVLEWGRFAAERFVLVPSARWLPVETALSIADAIGRIDAAIPSATSRAARQELFAAGVASTAVGRAQRRRLAMPRHDIAWRQRFRRGAENVDDWELIEDNPGPVHRLLDEGVSFIAAGGHFTAAAGDLRHKVLPMVGRAVGGAVPRWSPNPFELRRRLDAQSDEGAREGLMKLGTKGKNLPRLLAEVPDLWHRSTHWAAAPAFASVQDQVLSELAMPGSASQILIDAYWEKATAYRRPFAGIADRGFALGAARIARLGQCPVVPFVAVLGPRPRTVIYEWGDPIFPRDRDDKESDREVIDEALAFLERGVVRYPEQYLHPIGSARKWDAASGRWLAR